MTLAKILEEIRRLPLEEKKVLLEELQAERRSPVQTNERLTQGEFEQLLMDDGLLANCPVDDDDDDDFEPVEFVGQPISQTIIDERR